MKIYTQGGFGSITYFNDTLWVNLPDHVNVGVARGVLPTPPTGMAHVLQDSDKAMIKSTGITFFAAIVCTMVALQHPLRAQTQAASVSVNGFRPMAVVVSQLEQLSGIPINYEDLRCDFVGDQTIIQGAYTAAQQAMAVKNGVVGPLVDIAPRGGSLSATITVNASGKLSDTSAVASALNSVLSAYSGSGLPGAFGLEQYNGTFFVAPNLQRDQSGATITVPPVLSTLITLSVNQATAFQVLDEILAQVSQRSGLRIGVGTVPVNALAMGRVTFNAVQEPANHVLAWLLNSLLGYPQILPSSSPSLAYRVLYDPKLRYYMFNVVEVGVGLGTQTAQPVTPVPSAGSNPRVNAK